MPTGIFLIPSGPKNLAVLFPDIDWSKVDKYIIDVQDSTGTSIAVSPLFTCNCCCPDDKIRLHFLNALGSYDAVNFLKPNIIHEDTNDEFQNSPGYPLQKTDTGIERFNIKGQDTYQATVNLNEADMPFIRELADSPKLYLEWIGTEGQPDDYIPMVKIADKFSLLKNDKEFAYQYIIQFKLSNTYMIARN